MYTLLKGNILLSPHDVKQRNQVICNAYLFMAFCFEILAHKAT